MSDIRHSTEALCAEIRALSAELCAEMRCLKTELCGEMRGLKTELERRFDRMETRFNWLIGIVVTSSVTTVGAVAGAFWGLLQSLR